MQKSNSDSKLLEKFLEFKKSELFKNYKYDQEEVCKIKIDINFADSCNSVEVINWAKEQLKVHPEIKPLIQVLKRYLQINKLNSSFDGKNYFNLGGLSSYSLLLILIAFIKISQFSKESLGKTLFNFFEFYGKLFDFTDSFIDVNQLKYFC